MSIAYENFDKLKIENGWNKFYVHLKKENLDIFILKYPKNRCDIMIRSTM